MDADERFIARLCEAVQSHPDIKILRRIPRMPIIDLNAEGADRAKWKKAVVIDTETDGLDTKTAKIIELGIAEIFYDESDSIRAFGRCRSWFEDPGHQLSEETVRITKITDEMVAGLKLPEQEIREFVGDADLVIAFKADFDRPIVERRFPWAVDKFWACAMTEIPWKDKFNAPGLSLTTLAWNAGFFFDAHRADSDCAALSYLLYASFNSSESAFEMMIESARKPTSRFFATGAPFERKDELKARGYKWNVERKVWTFDASNEETFQKEWDFLKNDILRGRDPTVETFNGRSRYSNRV